MAHHEALAVSLLPTRVVWLAPVVALCLVLARRYRARFFPSAKARPRDD